MDFVLDNSVTMRWLLVSQKANDQRYAESVLQMLIERKAFVPNLWHLEVSNVLNAAEKRGDISVAVAEGFIAQIEQLSIRVDGETAKHAWNRSLVLARNYKLSSYDAAYLELALRMNLPLASLDQGLIKAAKKAGVPLYLKA